MAKFNLPIGFTASMTFDLNNPNALSASIDFVQSQKAINEGRENGGKILYATTHIIQKIDKIIADFLMGSSPYPSPEKNFLSREIIESSTFHFRFKRNILEKVINKKKILKGKEKELLREHLTKIERYRNAFAHGEIFHDSRDGLTLKYYENGHKTIILDELYWQSTEKIFAETIRLLDDFQKKQAETWLPPSHPPQNRL